MSRIFLLILAAWLCVAPASALPSNTADSRQSVGLVLSGGGAKGIAHIGVIQALEDNNIPIDYITGTSMGSIIGALYAMGYTPQEMMDLILSRGFSYWSTGKIDPKLTYYFAKDDASPAMLTMPIGPKSASAGDSIPASLISPLPMSFAFMQLFSAYTAQCEGDFDKLFVPFHCVASDVARKRKHVFRGGQFGDAVRASMSFPIVFQPITIDGQLYYDGGIYDNFPVDVMREDFAPSIILGVDVSTEVLKPQTTLLDQIENLVIQNNDYDLPASEGIKIRLDLNRFGLLDFPAAKAIYQVGYDKTMQMIDSIKGRVTSRMPADIRTHRREVFKSKTPHLRFDNVDVYGARPHQNQYIKYIFDKAGNSDTLGITRAKDAFYRALSSGNIKDLYPQAHYNDTTGLFDMTLKATMGGRLKGSLGGYLSSSTNSFIYLSADYSTMSFRSLNTSLRGWIGQSTMAGRLSARMYLHTVLPSAIGAEVVAERRKFFETDQMFFDAQQPTFLVDKNYFGRLMWSFATGRLGKVDMGVGVGSLQAEFFQNSHVRSYEGGKLRSDYSLAQAFARYTSSTLDTHDFPTSGHDYNICAMGITGRNTTTIPEGPAVRTSPQWLQLELRTRNYPQLSQHFALGLETDILLSTRKLLPTYSASIATAPGYYPTPSSNNAFHPVFHANSFLAAGIIPVYKINSNLSARIGGYAFMPLRRIHDSLGSAIYGGWLRNPEMFCEGSVAYNLPFGASLSAHANYSTIPGDRWNVGLSFGIYILPPNFLR